MYSTYYIRKRILHNCSCFWKYIYHSQSQSTRNTWSLLLYLSVSLYVSLSRHYFIVYCLLHRYSLSGCKRWFDKRFEVGTYCCIILVVGWSINSCRERVTHYMLLFPISLSLCYSESYIQSWFNPLFILISKNISPKPFFFKPFLILHPSKIWLYDFIMLSYFLSHTVLNSLTWYMYKRFACTPLSRVPIIESYFHVKNLDRYLCMVDNSSFVFPDSFPFIQYLWSEHVTEEIKVTAAICIWIEWFRYWLKILKFIIWASRTWRFWRCIRTPAQRKKIESKENKDETTCKNDWNEETICECKIKDDWALFHSSDDEPYRLIYRSVNIFLNYQ